MGGGEERFYVRQLRISEVILGLESDFSSLGFLLGIDWHDCLQAAFLLMFLISLRAKPFDVDEQNI